MTRVPTEAHSSFPSALEAGSGSGSWDTQGAGMRWGGSAQLWAASALVQVWMPSTQASLSGVLGPSFLNLCVD